MAEIVQEACVEGAFQEIDQDADELATRERLCDVAAKALSDAWVYTVGLRSGLILRCAWVESDRPGWVTLRFDDGVCGIVNWPGDPSMLPNLGRGMAVRSDEIAWMVDENS